MKNDVRKERRIWWQSIDSRCFWWRGGLIFFRKKKRTSGFKLSITALSYRSVAGGALQNLQRFDTIIEIVKYWIDRMDEIYPKQQSWRWALFLRRGEFFLSLKHSGVGLIFDTNALPQVGEAFLSDYSKRVEKIEYLWYNIIGFPVCIQMKCLMCGMRGVSHRMSH